MKVPQFTRSEEWTKRAGSVHRSTKFDGQARNRYVVEFANNESSPLNVDLGVAPEKAQAFGDKSKVDLPRLVSIRDVQVEGNMGDRYQRIVGKGKVQPPDCPTCAQTLDAGLAQVATGMAWWYREYVREQTAEDPGDYEHAKSEARVQPLGLWHDKNPVPPWSWRRR